MEDLNRTLEAIRPSKAGGVMDLVAAAGIDVTPWHTKADGTPVKNPRANPHYCYEWSFGGTPQPTALCVWHKDIQLSQGAICYEDSLRQFALTLDRLAIEPRNPSHVKSRARDQAKRARSFDSHVQRAYRSGAPVRVILLVGDDKGGEQLGWETSKVMHRALDSELWHVSTYSDDDGRFRLVRGERPDTSVLPAQPLEAVVPYADQFSIPAQPDRVSVEALVRPRSPEVRRNVLLRAQGRCEFCDASGFQMANGSIYLETHHVVPLTNDGPDVEWNVVAICPNDHRRAHFSTERESIMRDLIEKLASQEPLAREALTNLANRLLSSDGSH